MSDRIGVGIDRGIQIGSGFFQLCGHRDILSVERQSVADKGVQPVADADLTVLKIPAVALPDPRRDRKIGFGVKADHLYRNGTAAGREGREEVLCADLTDALTLRDFVHDGGIHVEIAGVSEQDNVFEGNIRLGRRFIGHDHDIRAHPVLQRGKPAV